MRLSLLLEIITLYYVKISFLTRKYNSELCHYLLCYKKLYFSLGEFTANTTLCTSVDLKLCFMHFQGQTSSQGMYHKSSNSDASTANDQKKTIPCTYETVEPPSSYTLSFIILPFCDHPMSIEDKYSYLQFQNCSSC